MTGQRLTLDREIQQYLRHVTIERGLSDNSIAAYRRDLNRYRDWLAEQQVTALEGVTPAQVQEFIAWLRSPRTEGGLALAASSVSRIASSVRGLHRFALDEQLVQEDATADIVTPKLPTRLPKALTIAQVEQLLEASGGDAPEQLRNRALLELLYATGARISEAVALDVDDVIDQDMIRVRGKGDKQRIVPLGSYARQALDAYLVRARPQFAAAGRSGGALFLGVRGKRLSRTGAFNILQQVAQRAQLSEHVSPHVLRHSFATHLMQGGADVRVVQELLGHASVSTTQIYTRVTADALRDMYLSSHPRARG